MKHLRAVNKYFWKYRWRFLLGLVFIILSNYFRILTPQVTGYVVNSVERQLQAKIDGNKAATEAPKGPRTTATTAATAAASANPRDTANYDILVRKFIGKLDSIHPHFDSYKVAVCGVTLLVLALISGFFLFLMRQTIIVMSRHIEYDQKERNLRPLPAAGYQFL